MNDDTIFHIQQFIPDFDFLYHASLIDTRFCIKKRRKHIQLTNNSVHLLKTFVNFMDDVDTDLETELEYLNEFINMSTISDSIQWYSNVLLKNIPFYRYEHQKRGYALYVPRYPVSNGITGKVIIRNYPTYLHNVYRCRCLKYKTFERNLTVKALIF